MIKLLVLTTSNTDAPAFYRSSGPLSRLKDVQVTFSEKVDWSIIMPADVVMVMRPHTTNMVGVCEYVKKCKKPLLLDADDDYFNIPSHNPSAKEVGTEQAKACFKACIDLADIITVSTRSIKESILEHCPDADVRVISNAVDTELFSIEPSGHVREKIVLYRGGGSHEADLETYKQPILNLIKNYPEYRWAFMGYVPRFVVDSGIEDDRLLIFPYTDTMKYFETLMELKPEIMIVPLEDTKFNRGKSNCSLLEGVVAGAAVMATDLPEFINSGACVFNQYDIEHKFFLLTQKDVWHHYYRVQINSVPTLEYTNYQRQNILKELILNKSRYTAKKETKDPSPATDKEFFTHCLTHAHIQESQPYVDLHRSVAKWIKESMNPRDVIEFGAGPGALIEYLTELGINATGLELNPYFIEYFEKKNPFLKGSLVPCDFINETPEFEGIHDLGISIEVFEHISMTEEKWNEFIRLLSTKFRYFYFSSTPFRDKPSWDKYWGHINIRTTKNWIKLWESNGWKLEAKPKVVTGWDILFKSESI